VKARFNNGTPAIEAAKATLHRFWFSPLRRERHRVY
jgi:hypothetical protein